MPTMDWCRLLTDRRLCDSKERVPDKGRTEFGRDFDRILFSTPFRRLRDKTQVFPMPVNDHIHNRLTHSIEVASVGRSLGRAVGFDLLERHPGLRTCLGMEPSDFGDIVAAACLMHDIGNPPFGHAGEDAMRRWFRARLDVDERLRPAWSNSLSKEEITDLCNFEGNAQGFRVVSRLSMKPGRGGMQLTHATLCAFMKYPQGSPQILKGAGISRKKFGFFQSERDLFREAAESCGLIEAENWSWCRHPLAWLVEAADDICYNILDAEDGYTLGLIRFEDYRDLVAPLMGRSLRETRTEKASDRRDTVALMRALALHNFIEKTRQAFLDNEEAILSGQLGMSLVDLTDAGAGLRTLTAHVSQKCYNAVDVLQIQVAGYQVFSSLLDLFVPAVMASPEELRSLDKVIYEFLLRDVSEVTEETSVYGRLLRIADYISGMTDHFAMNLYRRFAGVSLPGRG